MSNELLENVNQILVASDLYIDSAIIDQEKRGLFLENSKKYILMAIDEIKKLSNLLTPPLIGVIGLIESLNNWMSFKRQGNSINFIAEWKNINDLVICDKLQLTIYRIVQEQINNTIKYSFSKNANIILQQTEDLLELIIKDDGVGFDSLKISQGVGLLNITTRAEISNGKMLLRSKPGKGCMLKLSFPI